MFYCCFFKQKTAYEMRISDWSSDVCSSDLPIAFTPTEPVSPLPTTPDGAETDAPAAPEPAEPVSSIDVGQLVEALASSDPAAATEAVAGLRDALMKNAAIDDVRDFVQRLMMAAERDVEADSILLREIITESLD